MSSPPPPTSFLARLARRRHRDRDIASAGTALADAHLAGAAPALTGSAWPTDGQATSLGLSHDDEASTYSQELARDPRWLRFTPEVEARFQADTARSRWLYLIGCYLLGVVSLWIGILNERNTLPDTASQVIPMWVGISAWALGATLVCAVMGPQWTARGWRLDALGTGNGAIIGLGIVWATGTSQAFSATVHAANIVLVVMWGCILCRFRFRYALFLTTLLCSAYLALARGDSEAQQVVVISNLKILAFTSVFSLIANYALEFVERRGYLLRKLGDLQAASLADAEVKLRELSVRDPLTGLYNRRQFEADLSKACNEAAKAGKPLAMLMLDIDFFKRYNDSYGHPAGDACLGRVAQVLQTLAARFGGSAARLGGEEFALLLPGLGAAQAEQAGRAVCEAVQGMGLAHRASGVSEYVTVSVGAAAFEPETAGAAGATSPWLQAELPLQADAALYDAKQTGRNRASGRSLHLPVAVPAPGGSGHHAAVVEGAAVVAHAPSPVVTVNADAPIAAAPPANEPADDGAAADSEAALTDVIRKGFHTLRFPKPLEAQYQHAQAAERRRHLTVSSLLGILIFNGYCFTNRSMMPDVADWFRGPQLAVTVFMLLLASFVALPDKGPLRLRIQPWMRETAYAAGNCAVVYVSLLVFSRSEALVAYAGYIAVFLVPMFAGAAARLPFWYTCLPALTSFIGFIAMAHADTPLEEVLVFDVMTMLLNATFFVLVASYALERGRRMDFLLARLGLARREALAKSASALRRLSLHDPLTGLPNRRCFEEHFLAWHRQARQGGPEAQAQDTLSLLILDVDHFKRFNDGYGHPAGDACLRRIAKALQGVSEAAGTQAARLGGEEFVVLLPGADLARAVAVGERICRVISDEAIAHRFADTADHVTVSVGVATLDRAELPGSGAEAGANAAITLSRLLSRADEALYRAKAEGRNRVLSAPLLKPAPHQLSSSGVPTA